MLRVAVINDYMGIVPQVADWSALDGLANVTFYSDHIPDEDAAAARLKTYDVIVAERDRTPFTRALIERLPQLKLLVTTGAVNWLIDLDAAKARGVTVCYTGGTPGAAPELTWGLLLSLSRRIAWDHNNVQAGGWQTALGVGLAGKTLGLVGLGHIGRTMVRYAKAFDMKTIAWSPNLTFERAEAAGTTLADLETVMQNSDFVSIHMVLAESTRGLIGAFELALMKNTAYLINTSRGPLVDEKALIPALKARAISGAGLDVFDTEPLPKDHPFRTLDNVVITPHTGYITDEQYKVFFGEAVENVLAFARGSPVRVMTENNMIAALKAES
jgi:phosphoglycerate dehydrogenase-like enzyme